MRYEFAVGLYGVGIAAKAYLRLCGFEEGVGQQRRVGIISHESVEGGELALVVTLIASNLGKLESRVVGSSGLGMEGFLVVRHCGVEVAGGLGKVAETVV